MTDDRTCPWEILGVSPRDDAATIRKAWRALVRQYHPDLARTDREAANRQLAEINAAFDAVSEPAAAQRRIAELRRAEAARRAKSAHDARERAAQASDRAAPDTDRTAPRTPRQDNPDPAERRRAQAAREAFDRALRVLDGVQAPRGSPIYL